MNLGVWEHNPLATPLRPVTEQENGAVCKTDVVGRNTLTGLHFMKIPKFKVLRGVDLEKLLPEGIKPRSKAHTEYIRRMARKSAMRFMQLSKKEKDLFVEKGMKKIKAAIV